MSIGRESEPTGYLDRVPTGKGSLRAAIVLPADSVGDEDSLRVGLKRNSPPSLPNIRAEQLEDGGWNCYAPPSKRSSFHSTICVLEGLLEYEKAKGATTALLDARLRGQEYLAVAIAAPQRQSPVGPVPVARFKHRHKAGPLVAVARVKREESDTARFEPVPGVEDTASTLRASVGSTAVCRTTRASRHAEAVARVHTHIPKSRARCPMGRKADDWRTTVRRVRTDRLGVLRRLSKH
jgi:hypothetical protein